MPYAPTCVCQPEEMRPQTCFVRDERVSFKCLDDLTSVRSVASSNQVEHHVRRSSLAAADRCPRSTPKTSLAFPPLAPGRRNECDVNKPLHCAGGFPARVQQGDSGRLPRQGACARPPPPTSHRADLPHLEQARQTHPDKVEPHQRELATGLFQKVATAFGVLGDGSRSSVPAHVVLHLRHSAQSIDEPSTTEHCEKLNRRR